jgi:hypothetical protein
VMVRGGMVSWGEETGYVPQPQYATES